MSGETSAEWRRFEESELHTRHYAEIEVASGQTLARKWSLAFHARRSQPDSIVYPSRLNGHTNLAVFDRAIVKLQTFRKMKLIDAPGLGTVLDDLKIGIVGPDA